MHNYQTHIQSIANDITESDLPFVQVITDILKHRMGKANPYTLNQLDRAMAKVAALFEEHEAKQTPLVKLAVPPSWRG
jgi:hypothetical protein